MSKAHISKSRLIATLLSFFFSSVDYINKSNMLTDCGMNFPRIFVNPSEKQKHVYSENGKSANSYSLPSKWNTWYWKIPVTWLNLYFKNYSCLLNIHDKSSISTVWYLCVSLLLYALLELLFCIDREIYMKGKHISEPMSSFFLWNPYSFVKD